jgi:hypothetical protein
MELRVFGVGMILGVAVSSAGRAGAQSAPAGTAPAGAASVPEAPAPTAQRVETAPLDAAPPIPPATPPPVSPTPPTPRGEDAPTTLRAHDAQDYFGFGAQIGDYNPSGLTVRVGGSAISLQVTAGFLPVLFVHYQDGDTRDGKLKFLLPFEVTPQLVIHAATFRNAIRGNVLLGYRYNSVLGHAATLGGQIEKRVSRKWLLEGMFGVSYYPRAEDRLLGDKVPKNDTFAFPTPQVSSGITIGALFYP